MHGASHAHRCQSNSGFHPNSVKALGAYDVYKPYISSYQPSLVWPDPIPFQWKGSGTWP